MNDYSITIPRRVTLAACARRLAQHPSRHASRIDAPGLEAPDVVASSGSQRYQARSPAAFTSVCLSASAKALDLDPTPHP